MVWRIWDASADINVLCTYSAKIWRISLLMLFTFEKLLNTNIPQLYLKTKKAKRVGNYNLNKMISFNLKAH